MVDSVRRLQGGPDSSKQVGHIGGVRVHSGVPDSSKQVGDLGGMRVHSGGLQEDQYSSKQVGHLGGLRVQSGSLQEGPESSTKQVGHLGGVRVHSGVAANSCWIRGTLQCYSSRLFAVHDHVSSNLVDFLAVFNI